MIVSARLETWMQASRDSGGQQKRATGTDIYIAGRLRIARKLAKMSQEQLAARVGITFQQIQKYETGANRLSASRLYQIALIFSQPVSFFLPPAPNGQPQAGGRIHSDVNRLMALMSIPEITDLHTAYLRITDTEVRRRVLALVRSIAENSE